MYASKFNVFCLTETWLSDLIFDSEVLPHDFISIVKIGYHEAGEF